MKVRMAWYSGIAAFCAAALLFGCRGSDKARVVVKPRFEYTQIKRVAVVGFENSTGDPRAGNIGNAVADKLTAVLVQNGTYQVVTRDKLQAVLTEQNLSVTSHVDPATAMKIGKIAAVDMIIAGRVTQHKQDTRNETRYRDVYDWSSGKAVKTGTVPYAWTRYQADVSVSLQMISTTTGQVIWSDDKSYSSWSEGSPPRQSMGQCEEIALLNVVNALAGGLVPHVADVKVPKNSIYTCKSFVAGQFMDKTAKFTDRDDTVQAVLALTPEFKDTTILLRIVNKDNDQIVFQQEYVWTGQYGQYGFPYKIADIIQKGGCGKYEAVYFIGGNEMAVAEFQIRPTKK